MKQLRIKLLSEILIAIVGLILLLSTLAMVQYPSRATPKAILSITNTELPIVVKSATSTVTLTPSPTTTPTPTSTPTSTVTLTPSPTATPAYPSVEEIDASLRDDFAQITSALDQIKNKPGPTHLSNIIDNLISNGIWEIFVALWAFFGLGNIFFRVKAKKDKADGQVSQYDDLAKSFSSALRFITITLIIYFLVPIMFFIGQSAIQSINGLQLASISQKLDRIENQLDVLSPTEQAITPTPNSSTTQPPSNKTDLQMPLAIFLGIVLVFLFIASIIARSQTIVYVKPPPNLNWEVLGRKLLPAVFLVLILLLLPDPIEAILLLILIPFFIYSFFDVVILYPNFHLQDIVTKHYSKIIFLAVFGVWYRFFNLLQNYVYPFWYIIDGYLRNAVVGFFANQEVYTKIISSTSYQFWYELPYDLVQFAWTVMPIFLATIYTIIPWHRIRKISEEKYISKLISQKSVK